MIVGSYFDGDEDMKTAWTQHNVYSDALRAITGECRSLVFFAHYVAGTGKEIPRPDEITFDHRTLQSAHDILAAVWRHDNDLMQLELPFENPKRDMFGGEITPIMRWLWWLRDEVRSWIDEPQLVRAVWTIIENQNNERGYEAEDVLKAALLYRFSRVPWKASMHPL